MNIVPLNATEYILFYFKNLQYHYEATYWRFYLMPFAHFFVLFVLSILFVFFTFKFTHNFTNKFYKQFSFLPQHVWKLQR